MRWILLLAWIGVLVFILLSLVSSLFRKFPSRGSVDKGSDMVLDEVCKVYIPKDRARSLKSRGKTYYFCSMECERKFLAQTEKNGIF